MPGGTVRFVTPHHLVLGGPVATLHLPATGETHRLTGSAADISRRIIAGDTDPRCWPPTEQDALEALIRLGVVVFSDDDAWTRADLPVSRRAMVTGAAGLGIATLLLPHAAAAATWVPLGDGSGGGSVVLAGGAPGDTSVDGVGVVGGVNTVSILDNGPYAGSFDVADAAVAINYLIVGGGGGGARVGGGGGAGWVVTGTQMFLPGTYALTVGTGGAAGTGTDRGASGASSSIAFGSTQWIAAGGTGGFSSGGSGGSSRFAGGNGGGSLAGGGGGGNSSLGGDVQPGSVGGVGGAGLVVAGFTTTPLQLGGGGGGGGLDPGTASHGGGIGGTTTSGAASGQPNSGGGGGGGGANQSQAAGNGAIGRISLRTMSPMGIGYCTSCN